ncbi:MAG: RNA polymerase sigma factor [Phycisphaerae bacterium]|nr:RNA polymerase sigma factor [Phycisphaerae bacterium]
MEELKKGSPQAFQVLVELHSRNVITTCYGFVNSKEDAEDVAQEVFLEIYRSVRQFRKEANLDTWIYRICINKSLDFVRKQKRKKRIADLRGLFGSKNRVFISAHQKLEEKERKEILQGQIALLAENQRVALILSQFDKFSNKQIAEIMEISESAVESLLHRARENLRKHLAKYFENKL